MQAETEQPKEKKQADSPGPGYYKQLPSAFSLFRPSIKALGLNFWTFAIGALLPIIFLFLPIVLFYADESARLDGTQELHTSTLVNILAMVCGIIGLGLMFVMYFAYLYYLKYQSAKGVKMSFKETLDGCWPFFWRMLGLTLLRGLIIIVGFILLIVPGLFMWKRYMLAPYYLMDKNLGIRESLRRSAADSKPYANAIWGLIGVYVLIWLIGILPVIGYASSLISILYCCAQALRYLQIKEAKL